MVQSTKFGKFRHESEIPTVNAESIDDREPVNRKFDGNLGENSGPLKKKSKLDDSSSALQKSSAEAIIDPEEYAPFVVVTKKGGLGLTLRKSPSLLDMIRTNLSNKNDNLTSRKMKKSQKDEKKESKGAKASEKMKASNFPASMLKIGNWKYVSRHEGDLVAKCYFAKHKIVWEILQKGLKSKIEIQWSEIKSLKAVLPEDGPGILDIVLARKPQFHTETNPQPRKHTVWITAQDFTNGQASTYRRHTLQCPLGSLNKHFEKLIQCDSRLYALSQKSDINLENPYFEQTLTNGQNGSEQQLLDQMNVRYENTVPTFQNASLAHTRSLVSTRDNLMDPSGGTIGPAVQRHYLTQRSQMPFNVHNSADQVLQSNMWNQCMQMYQPPMPITTVLNQIGTNISETAWGFGYPGQQNGMWADLAQNLLSDSQLPVSDEQSVLAKVNSFGNLLQDETNIIDNRINDYGISGNSIPAENRTSFCAGEYHDPNVVNQSGTLYRNDSYGELMMGLPQIATLPSIFTDVSEELN